MATIILRSEEANLGLLQYQTVDEMYKKLFFARYMGFVEQSSVPGEERAPLSPIIMKRDFSAKGMDFMKIPMLKNLTGTPIYGDQQLKGTGERQDLNYLNVYINQRRKAVAPPARMANQRVSGLNLVEQARPQVSTWYARNTEHQIIQTFCDGFSPNITTATTSGGLGITKRLHPAIFAADAGQITFNNTYATYAGNIHTATNGWTGTDDQKMSARVLREFSVACNKREIPTMNVGGFEVRPLLIHPNQWLQLMTDSEFLKVYENGAFNEVRKNPIFTMISGLYAGFAISVREFSIPGITTTASTVTWGATNPLSAVDTNARKAAICFSIGAMCGGWAFGPHYTTEVDDHGNWQEIGVAMIDGFARADYQDSTSSPSDTPINKSSAILLTYSPDSWN